MLKLLREGTHKYPWLLQAAMMALAVTFVVGMGWWGYSEHQADVVATVGPLKVSRDEYVRRFKNLYELSKQQKAPDLYKDDVLKQIALEQLIEEKLWLLSAEDMGLTASPTELRDTIVNIKEFQQNGKFDPELYRRLLVFNHLTPAQFEADQTVRLLGDKAMTVIMDSVALTPSELEEAKALMARQSSSEPITGPSANDRIVQDMLFQKQQRALAAFKESLRATTPIQIRKELL